MTASLCKIQQEAKTWWGSISSSFSVGQTFVHEIRRTVTDMDNILFSSLTCNPAAIHIDRDYAEGTEFGKPLINSIFTLGLIIGLSVQDTTLGTKSVTLAWKIHAFRTRCLPATRCAPNQDRRCAREQVTSEPGHRYLRASRLQSAPRRGGVLPEKRVDDADADMNPRSLLFVPADSERKFAKADGIGADALILDLAIPWRCDERPLAVMS